MEDTGEVVYIKVEPDVDVLKEELMNDSCDEFNYQCTPISIKDEPDIPSDGGSGWTTCVKEECADEVAVEDAELDYTASNVNSFGSCSVPKEEPKAPWATKLSNVKGRGSAMKHRKHVCEVCGSGFNLMSALNKHMRIHTGDKRYVCVFCDARFIQAGNLKAHLRTHTGEKPHTCSICEASFTQAGNLKAHMRTHTGERPYVCDICSSRFTTASYLKTHKRTHTGERPCVCDICGLGFSQVSTLKKHKRTHTGEKPFVCGFCDSRFSQAGNLKAHEKTHTRVTPQVCVVQGDK